MGISEISALGSASTLSPVSRTSPHEVAAEFDAMIWTLLLRESGLLNPLTAGNGEAALVSELFMQNVARELSAQTDIGLGRMLLAAFEGEAQTKGVEP